MGVRTLSTTLVAFPALLLAGCNSGNEAQSADGDGETGIDCPAVEVIVPYSPGGGSDQQVRRLQQALEDALDTQFNINYQTGGDGSVGWNALAGAEPDGCTIANVVAPNIINLSLTAGDDVGFAAEDFEYIGWTEYSPNIIAVGHDSRFETIEDFVSEAEANPGNVTISGVGSNGELLVSEINQAIGIDLSFVPVSGGVGDIIPQVAGGHIDAAYSGFSLLDGDQLTPLALSAPSDEFPDVPTFEEAGYPGVNLVTSWGFILPPDTPSEIVEAWNAGLQEAMATDDVQAAYEETGFTVLEQDVDEAREYFQEQYDATEAALEAMQ
ncbi:tripartite tricarboxylate transporter substrate binding protein [Phytoactinopolyspora halophila]|nr:tripartite tricarboxylate transporter substrate binding protein [Phytoactinopolyspora halophila]